MAIYIQRREFIFTLGGAAAGWPLAARAQQGEQLRLIGVLDGLSEFDPEGPPRVMAFQRELQDLGWTEGRNIRIEYRWAGGDADRIRTFAAELAGMRPDVVVARSTPTAEALARETHTIPIVFALVSDPIGSGLVASLARPGRNATGFTNFEFLDSAKWIEILKEISPRIRQVRAPVQSRNGPSSWINLSAACPSRRLILGGGPNHRSGPQRSRGRRCTRPTRAQCGQWPYRHARFIHER